MRQQRSVRVPAVVLLLFAVLAVVSGCARKEGPREGEQRYSIYYLNSAATRLVAYDYDTATEDVDSLLQELMENLMRVPAELDAQVAMTDKVEYQGYRKEDMVLYLFFDNNYSAMSSYREILCRAALTLTLTQAPGVDYINIYSGGQPLLDSSQMPVGMISASNFVDSITDVNAYERAELTLYFTDEEGEFLYPETRSVMHNVNTSVERVIVDELIGGPESSSLRPTLNPSTRVLNVSVNENVCYLNLDATFLNNTLEVKDYIPIYSIVNSLLEQLSVNRVQISVNGSQDVMFRDTVSLNTLFERNLDYIVIGNSD
ncbi:MAG: GerMN domain-containing protein [Clostridiales bacterium]|nr:GerMN domain-containing protein [Clostridiales bacterium]